MVAVITPPKTEKTFAWQGKTSSGQVKSGEIRARSDKHAVLLLRRQGVLANKIRTASTPKILRIPEKEIVLIVRQLATMLKSGVPLAQSFELMIRSQTKKPNKQLLTEIKSDIEVGNSLSSALKKHPRQFDRLFCGVLEAGEQAGMMDDMIDRLATYREKMLRLKARIKSALTYPTAVIAVALLVMSIILIKVIPVFKKVFADFNAQLPGPTLIVMAISDFMVAYWYWIFGALAAGIYFFVQAIRRSPAFRAKMDRLLLRIPIFGSIIRKAIIARWCRTFCTLFAAGVPMVEGLDSIAIVANNDEYYQATKRIQSDVAVGMRLSTSMDNTKVFPALAVQMVNIGEESGALDAMLDKVATQLEEEVDDAVNNLSTLIEPFIMVFMGVVIGGLIISMYLPIFNLGSVV
ncbi:MAG: type II secretion system F family protein [Burkholderiaceae bacterium]|jgi:type IV pilus assembly protein PilC